MKKTIKALTCGLILAIAMVCMGIFAAACNEDKNDGTAYNITVVYPDGKAVNGTADGTAGKTEKEVQVQFCEVDANNTELHCELPVSLDADGKASLTLPDLDEGHRWHVKVNGIPAGYTYTDDNYMSKPGSLTITLKNA